MRALFVPSNENQIKVMAPIADLILQEGGEVLFLSLDNYYNQGSSLALSKLNYPHTKLLARSLISNWWAINQEEQFTYFDEACSQLDSIASQFVPDVMILGNSLGELEQLAIKSANRFGFPTVLIQDGMIAKLDSWQGDIILPSVLAGPVDLICVWNEYLRRKLEIYRPTRRVVITGAPRYDSVANFLKESAPKAPYKVMVATQCFNKYGLTFAGEEVALYERLINRLLSRSQIGKVIVRPHPQTTMMSRYEEMVTRFGSRVEMVCGGDSLSTIQTVDCVMAASSTVLAEACMLGIAIADLSYLTSKNAQEYLTYDEKFDSWLDNGIFPTDFLSNQASSRDQFIEKLACRADGLASKRVITEINKLLADWNRKPPVTLAPRLTVIADLHPTDPLLSLNIILGETGREVRVLAIDRSASGHQKALVETIIKDDRLSFLHLPGNNKAQALSKAISSVSTDYLIILDQNSVLLPDAVEFTIKAFDDYPEFNTFLGAVSLSARDGVATRILTKPRENNFSKFLADPMSTVFTKTLFIRRSALSGLPDDSLESEFELRLLHSLAQNTAADKNLIGSLHPLSLYPYITTSNHKDSYLLFKEKQRKLSNASQDNNSSQSTSTIPVASSNSGAAPEISIMLCSYNREEKVVRCLEALANQSIDKSRYEVICVNDGSTDKTGANMQAGLKDLQGVYIEHEKNKALAAARNTALNAARGKYVLFINDDTYATPTFLEQHLKTHQQYAGKDIAVAGYLPFIEKYKNRIFSLALMDANLYFGYSGLPTNQPLPFWFFITGNLSVPRHLFEQHNVRFNETFTRYGYEDIECGYRLWQKGLNVYYNPEAQAIHDHLLTIQNFVTREEHNAVNILQFCVMHPDPILAENLIATKRLDEAMIKQWTDFVEGSRPRIPEIISQISSVQELLADMSSIESRAKAQHLIKEVGESTRLVALFTKFSTFLEVFKEHPEIKQALLSPDWEINAQRKFDEIGYSAML